MVDLIIQGDGDDLESIRQQIEREVGSEARVDTTYSAQAGELREPIIIGLIVALGGPVVTQAIVKIIQRYYENKEAMASIENDRLSTRYKHLLAMTLVNESDEEKAVTLGELRDLFSEEGGTVSG